MSEKKTRTALRLTAKTDVGRVREHNEDNYVVCPDVEKMEWFFSDTIIESEEGTLLVVADGMGGLNAGEVASAIAIETIQQYFNQDNRTKIETHEQVKAALIDCINIAQSNMLNHAKEHPDTTGMGTTIVIAFIKENILHTAWVGDSRCYVLRKNTELYYATKDHSYVQELVDANQLTMEQAFYHPESNIITRSLGDNSNKIPKPDVCAYPIVAGDKILLCSDGLNGMLQDDAILKILHETENINEAAIKLINTANEAGGHDNITLILSEIILVSKVKPYYYSSKSIF
jgi:protein phosphatase